MSPELFRTIYRADWAREAFEKKALRQDGDAVVLTIGSASQEWIKRFCLKFGADAQLLAPAAARREMVKTIAAIRSLYKEDPQISKVSPN